MKRDKYVLPEGRMVWGKVGDGSPEKMPELGIDT